MQSNDAPMKEFVIDMLKRGIPQVYHYHNYEHTLYVTDKAVEIAQNENCTEEEIELLRTAALWHDTGFINTYAGHEKEGCSIVWKHLPAYGYSNEQIERICGMIMATRLPQSPKNKLEEIIADADLEYLGTSQVYEKAEHLFQELRTLNLSLTRVAWNRVQVSFLQSHNYFTNYCKEWRDPAKAIYLEELKNLVAASG